MENYAHQTNAVERFKGAPYGALFMEPGCGKSRILIQIAEHKFSQGEITAVMLVTTLGLVSNWHYTELPLHSTRLRFNYVWGDTKEMPGAGEGLVYFLINIDALVGAKFPPVYKDFLRKHPKFMFVIDESTVVKNMKATRTRAAMNIARKATARFIMSGTPTPQSPMDIYSQSEILSPQLLGFKSIYVFRARYAEMTVERYGQRTFQKIVSFKNLPELRAKINTWADMVKKKDCLDLPPRISKTIDSPLGPEQAKAYSELKSRALTYINEHEITASTTMGIINRLLQICAGQVKLDDGTYISIPTPRLSLLKELIDRTDEQGIVWTFYVRSAQDILGMLGKEGIHLPSGLRPEPRHRILQSFKKGGGKILVANQASAGHGITLVEASQMFYYSQSCNLEHKVQSEDRNHRIGQIRSVVCTTLVAKGTVEERWINLLEEKRTLADLVISKERLLGVITDGY